MNITDLGHSAFGNTMVEVTPSLSSKIRNMSIVCAFMVVMIHCRPCFHTGTFAWWVKQFTENGFTQIAVPFFFLVSGFFIAPKICNTSAVSIGGGYKLEVMKRLRTLVVPYFTWIFLFWIFTLGMSNLLRCCQGAHYYFYFPNLEQWGLWYKNNPLLTPLWYVRGLFLIVLMAPIFAWLLRCLGVWALLLLFVIYGVLCPYDPMPYWSDVQRVTRTGIFPVLGIFYFTFGMAIRMGVVRIKTIRGWAVVAIGCASILIFARAYFADVHIAPYFGMLSIPFALYGLWCLIPNCRWPQWIVGNSFAVFLVHKFLIFVLIHFMSPGRSVVFYFLVAMAAFLISLFVANALRKIAPKIFGFMLGGR